jgi:hypothetical protein
MPLTQLTLLGPEYDRVKRKHGGENTLPKTKHCIFKILNIVFSDGMFEKFLNTGKVPTKDNFTAATMANSEEFWRDVCAALAEPVAPNSDVKNDAFDKLQFEHPLFHGPALANIYRTKDWSRIGKMFGNLKREYRKVVALSTKSGTNNPDMANYVNGQASVRCRLRQNR